jgi:hypothetical protein
MVTVHLHTYPKLKGINNCLNENGHDPELKDNGGQMLLLWAAENGERGGGEAATCESVDLDFKDKTYAQMLWEAENGYTPLSWAAGTGTRWW